MRADTGATRCCRGRGRGAGSAVGLLVVLLQGAVSSLSAGAEEGKAYVRSGFYGGFSVGAAGVKRSTEHWGTDRTTAATLGLRAGYAATPRALIGVSLGTWPATLDRNIPPRAFIRMSGDIALYPSATGVGWLSGAFARGGMGVLYSPDDTAASDQRADLHAGVGYEVHLGRSALHAGLVVEWHLSPQAGGETLDYWEATLQIVRY